VHCYDIASATGQPFDPPADVVSEGFQAAHLIIQPEMRAAGSFGAEMEAPAGASPLEQMLAFSGRTV
jgi:hypothetical protein